MQEIPAITEIPSQAKPDYRFTDKANSPFIICNLLAYVVLADLVLWVILPLKSCTLRYRKWLRVNWKEN